jgi:putative NADH-flavin reductase
MKLAVFGGTGKTGQHVIQQALDAGHQVTALARTPSKLNIQHPSLSIIQGDVQNANCVAETIAGADAVISVLGPTSNKPEFAVSKGVDHILSAMRAHNIQRLIISTGAGVRDPNDKPKPVDRFFGLVLRVLSKNVVADMNEAIKKVRSNDLEWTVVRAPMLTDQPATGQLKVGYVGDISPRLSRADMAAFMLRQLENDTYVRKAPAISN